MHFNQGLYLLEQWFWAIGPVYDIIHYTQYDIRYHISKFILH